MATTNGIEFPPAAKDGQIHTQGAWFCDPRTNKRFTLKLGDLKSERQLQGVVHPKPRCTLAVDCLNSAAREMLCQRASSASTLNSLLRCEAASTRCTYSSSE